MRTAGKSTRITISGTPEFKAFLSREAKKEGITVAELVRQRCKGNQKSQEQEEVLAAMVVQLRVAVAKANDSINNAESVLAEMHSKIRA